MGNSSVESEVTLIVQRCLREDRTLMVADEADRLAPRYPDVSKRDLCDMLIAAAFAVRLPIELMETEESCRDTQAAAA